MDKLEQIIHQFKKTKLKANKITSANIGFVRMRVSGLI